jgi:endogenous inhibitor of DNA gyrase (YacG/DUF329 family)
VSESRKNPQAGNPAARTVACPACGKPAVFAESNRWRPFCGERCRLTDLGAWASESYRIPAKPGEDEAPGAAEDPDP